MATLADSVLVERRFARSANLERDIAQKEPLNGYIITARTLDVVERIATTAAVGPAGGAWSLTGPYGSGKSSLALLLDAALGEAGEARETAIGLIDDASRAVGDLIRRAHRRHGTHTSGFHRGLVTANREPLNLTVLRALHSAVLRSYDTIPPTNRFRAAGALRGALEDASTDDPRRTGPSPGALVEIARCLADDGPLLLVIDEFGKNLEASRADAAADPYLLQLLAEAGQGNGLPIFLLTLQHLSFEDYLAGADSPQRREWAKVQGRFEDVAFVESAAQTRALIGSAFAVVNGELRARIECWAQAHANAMRALGVPDLADPTAVARCYPLHPLAALVLPELCSRYGQHERTLFSFLAGPGPASAASYMAETDLPAQGQLPSLGLDAVYDYFVASGVLDVNAARQPTRWTEIATRLRDTHGLSGTELRLAKAVALLNLIATTGTVRASKHVLALVDDCSAAKLSELERAGVVTYRDFADEYRIWQGTDVDIRGLLDTAHQRVQRQQLVEVLSAIDDPQPVVAARHSAANDVLRVFARRYVDGSETIDPLDACSEYDGEVALVVGENRTVPRMARSGIATKPVVAAVPHDVTELAAAAREVAAVAAALDDPAVADDWVARRELGERLAQSRVAFEHATVGTFSAETCRWVLLGEDDSELPAGRGSSALSTAADLAYPSTPTVRNEMLNRTQLTSQGAKARRLLLTAMIEHGADVNLGFKGYGPEMAMYRAFLERTGLHGVDKRNSTRVFRAPTDPSLRSAWDLLEAEFRRAKSHRLNLADIHAVLLLPPLGMKAGAVPVFVTAGLLAFADEIAIYEHGTFKPLLTPEVAERMVRNPGHFEIKHFANTTGGRRQVVDALAKRLDVRPRFRKHRVANVLSIVGHLVSAISHLDNYTLRTDGITATTRSARDALVEAVEPDEMLFVTLPEVLGYGPVLAEAKTYANAHAYADSLCEALDELSGCYQRLLTELLQFLLSEAAETSRLAITGQAAALEGEVLDPAVRAFVLTLANDSVDSDEDWINAIATVVANRAPAEWTDDDLRRFRRELPERLASFHRLVALHANQRADGGGQFDALRVTVTRSDGTEHVRLVGVDHEQRHDLESALDHTLDELAELTGSPRRAHHALLALLGERLLPDQDHPDSGAGVQTGPPGRGCSPWLIRSGTSAAYQEVRTPAPSPSTYATRCRTWSTSSATPAPNSPRPTSTSRASR